MNYNHQFVSASISRIRQELNAQEPGAKDKKRVEQIQDVLDVYIAQFRTAVLNGKVEIDSKAFKEFVKLQLLLLDRPTEIVETRSEEEEKVEERYSEVTSLEGFEDFLGQLRQTMNAQNE